METKDCYFQIYMTNEDNFSTVGFIINPKEYWASEGCLDDSGDEPNDLPLGFFSMAEGVYEYEGLTSDGYKKLIKYGAEEKIMFDDDHNTVVTKDNMKNADDLYLKILKEHENELNNYETNSKEQNEVKIAIKKCYVKDCYFQVSFDMNDLRTPVFFLINQKELFDKNKLPYGGLDFCFYLPDGFSYICDWYYKYNGLPSEGYQKLIDAGVEEKNDMFGNPGEKVGSGNHIAIKNIKEANNAYWKKIALE